MATTKTIYGQAFISGDSLLQDVVFFVNSTQSENTVEVIKNIWEDLMDPAGKAKTNKKGYWYWEVEMTDTEDTDKTVKVKFECPKPEPSLFDFNFEVSSGDSDWTKYWKTKMKQTQDNLYNSTNGLQQKEVTLPGTKYVNQNGETVEVQELKYTRNDLGDIQNLLFNLY